MSLFPKLKIRPPKLANHNLRHYFRTSMAPGVLYPVMCTPINAGETLPFDIESLVNTQACLSPLYGTYDIQFDVYFAGSSLYIPAAWRNTNLRQQGGVAGKVAFGFPLVNFPLYKDLAITTGDDAKPMLFSKNCLMSYLGFNPGFYPGCGQTSTSGNWSTNTYNAVPLLMYLDIYRNYYVNRQEVYGYFFARDTGATSSKIASLPLATLDQLFMDLPKNGGLLSSSMGSSFDAVLSPVLQAQGYQLGGLCLRTYKPDKMNVILNSQFLANNDVKVDVADGSFTIDQLVQAKKIWDASKKDNMLSGTFKDWVRSHFGVTPKIMDDMPTFCGSVSSPIMFEDIRATTTQNITSSGGDYTQYLGDKASSASGYTKTRRFEIAADRPGFVMVIASITPRVDYYQNLERFCSWQDSTDLFMPEYNGIGLQDVLVSDLSASFNLTGVSDLPHTTDPRTVSVGKQPAWIEYMTRVNKVRGSFIDSESSWVLSRNMGVIETDDYAGVNSSAYIFPGEWNQPFAVQDNNAENFLVQIYFNQVSRSPVLKRLLPMFGK